jgi:hypothetical protein
MSLHWFKKSIGRLVFPDDPRFPRSRRTRPENPIPLRLEFLEERALLSIGALRFGGAILTNPGPSTGEAMSPALSMRGLVVSLPIVGFPGSGRAPSAFAPPGSTPSSDQPTPGAPSLPPSGSGGQAPGGVFVPPILGLPMAPPQRGRKPIRSRGPVRFAALAVAVVDQPAVPVTTAAPPSPEQAAPVKTAPPLSATAESLSAPTGNTIVDAPSNAVSAVVSRSASASESGPSSERTSSVARRSLLAPDAPTEAALDSFFLELWDQDQLLFPDAGPLIDETLFPDGFPAPDDMPEPGIIPGSSDSPL